MKILSAMTIWLLASSAPADPDAVWAAGIDQSDPPRCAIGWGGNPTGGVLIDRASGRVLDVATGRHLR